MPIPPPVITPGQGIWWSMATVVTAKPADVGATNGSATYGLDDNGIPDGTGLVVMNHSSALSNWIWAIEFSGFPMPPLPPHATPTAIYGVLVASITWDGAVLGNVEMATGTTITPWAVSMGGPTNAMSPTISTPLPETEFHSVSQGTDPTIIPSLKIAARLFNSTSIPTFNTQIHVMAAGLALYYDAPLMPIGHGVNANAYSPIILPNGATTAPGNGILIEVD